MRFLVAILLISISYARRFLHVPYNEKDQVKSLGARFDWELKSWWYLEINFRIEDNVPTKPFAKWLNPAPPKVRVNLPRKAKVLKPIPPPILEADGTPYVEVTTAQLHQEPLRFGDNGPYFDQIEHENYKASYNRAKRSIDWVEEHLNKKIVDSHRGAKMHNEYLQDSQVYSSFRQVPEEYIETNSTYTMFSYVPEEDSLDSNYMSIVSPMNTQLYNGMWLKLERFCRGLTEKYKDVYVVSGSLVLAEKSEKDDKMFVKYEIIGFNTIVPTHYYKIIMALDNVGVYHTRTIMLKNDQVEDAPLDKFTVDVGMVEERSGCRFFSHLQNAQIRTLKF